MKVNFGIYAKQLMHIVAILALLSWVMDGWRKPVAPAAATQHVLYTTAGERVSLAALSQHQTMVLYFWGSWCGICRHTSPTMDKLARAGVPVLGVPMQSGSREDVAAYMQQHGWTFANVVDADDLAQQWQVQVAPTMVLIHRGKVVHHTTGLSSYWGLRVRLWWTNWG